MAVSIRDLTLGYDRHPAVHHLDVEIETGSLTAIVGPNGAGKSTLLKGLTGELVPLEGRIDRKAARLAYLPQLSEVDRSFPITVGAFVAMGLWHRAGAFGRIRGADAARVAEALVAVGLTGFDKRPISALSGGQMQRVMFARVLLQDARLILLDEPFTALDTRTAAELLLVVKRWHGEGRTVLAVLHDMDAVRKHFPQTLLLAREKVAHGPTETVLTAENLFRARQMAEDFDDDAPVCERGAA
ncbi:zinc ABC transporter ATP-binding protein AztA [Frigidibacter mobilis]|uniref:ABC transporter ATP-binding protein n=1 Tax=Frigidibacter mobilis TaxID=1335048 RepID=A0A159Z0K2_9RHOB|nr:zinc ABC transporter ATP-binding protein AztA [Frigidibacter mobilis]AMY68395.1 ABC transporter ATP-binding protein [Frigidibacter mobilis]